MVVVVPRTGKHNYRQSNIPTPSQITFSHFLVANHIQGVPLKRALYFMGVANSESMIGGAPETYRRPQRGGKGM
jgi:hypothetical protein